MKGSHHHTNLFKLKITLVCAVLGCFNILFLQVCKKKEEKKILTIAAQTNFLRAQNGTTFIS